LIKISSEWNIALLVFSGANFSKQTKLPCQEFRSKYATLIVKCFLSSKMENFAENFTKNNSKAGNTVLLRVKKT